MIRSSPRLWHNRALNYPTDKRQEPFQHNNQLPITVNCFSLVTLAALPLIFAATLQAAPMYGHPTELGDFQSVRKSEAWLTSGAASNNPDGGEWADSTNETGWAAFGCPESVVPFHRRTVRPIPVQCQRNKLLHRDERSGASSPNDLTETFGHFLARNALHPAAFQFSDFRRRQLLGFLDNLIQGHHVHNLTGLRQWFNFRLCLPVGGLWFRGWHD